MVSKWVEREKTTPNFEPQENFIAAPCGVGRKVCSIVWESPTAAVMATSHPEKSPVGHSSGKEVRALLIAESFKPWMAHILHQGEKPGFLATAFT
ncbi:hypothetical protein [Microseira wollei]|uniref:hypothetical protein n=1 Tax=Microseira wollei TaxID=467598 RepID=UPI001CFE47E8|nr:hypothetical protein [Microseira wollei]